MKTLILISVVYQYRDFARAKGLHYLVAEGDFGWLDGVQMQHTPIVGELYNKIMSLLFQDGKPGLPFRVLKDEVKRISKFPDVQHERIVHCEVWV